MSAGQKIRHKKNIYILVQVNKQPSPGTNFLNIQVYMFTLQLLIINRHILHVHAVHEKQSQGMVYFQSCRI